MPDEGDVQFLRPLGHGRHVVDEEHLGEVPPEDVLRDLPDARAEVVGAHVAGSGEEGGPRTEMTVEVALVETAVAHDLESE